METMEPIHVAVINGETFSTLKGTNYFRSGPIVYTVVKQGRLSDLVVVNFSASWCGPCRMIAPFYTELSVKYPALTFLTIDVDELSEFSSSWDIHATPTFFFLKDKKQVDKLLGANKPELEKKVIAFADSAVQCSQ